MGVQYLPVDWKTYHTLARKLAASILSQEHNFPPQQIVAISRGGLTLGHLLSDFLRIPITTIAIQSYSDIQTHGEVKIITKLGIPIRGKHILLVDDVSDSGKTMKRAIGYLKRFKPKEITTVTMFFKPWSTFRPDFFAQSTNQWTLFPYEPTEMIYLITHNMEKEGKSKAVIQRMLEKLGYSDDEISFVHKYHLPH